MRADRTFLRRTRTDDNMAAVSALPDLHFALLEDSLCFYIVQQRAVALLMMLLDPRNRTELLSQVMEAFLIGSLRKTRLPRPQPDSQL